jgi:phosphoesterase RecJ-like protein
MYLAGDAPLPAELGFMPLDELVRVPPGDLEERVLLAVDCANARRLGPDPALLERAKLVVDVDHHHDNTRFGSVNLVVADASSTAEIVRDLLRELEVPLTSAIAEALYVGLVTDTGRFQYSNTTPKALRLAAELVEAGADVHGIFRHVYETVQFAKLKLLARALDRAQLFEGGRLLVSHLLRSDFEEVGAEEPYSEGIIDYLRQAEGAELVALIREPPSDGGPKRRVSLRSSRDEVDVSALARRSGGGGHRQAAGFASEASVEEITEFIRRGFVEATDGADAADAATRE